jgi:hypothetical protein
VVNTTYAIEDITGRQGGFVSNTTLKSDLGGKTITAISADSSLETTWYTVTNTMVIRVPNTALDSTLKSIAPLVDYMDYRIVKADDVALQLLSNRLTQKRAAKYEERLTDAIDNRGKKLRETISAEEILLNQQEQSDRAKLASLSLMDQVQFSTINLYIYQKSVAMREMVFNEKAIESYQPGLGSRLLDSLETGWEIVAALLVFLTRLWALILLALIAYFIYRKYGHRFRSK